MKECKKTSLITIYFWFMFIIFYDNVIVVLKCCPKVQCLKLSSKMVSASLAKFIGNWNNFEE